MPYPLRPFRSVLFRLSLVLVLGTLMLGGLAPLPAEAQVTYFWRYHNKSGNPGSQNTDRDNIWNSSWTSIITGTIHRTNEWTTKRPLPFTFVYFGDTVDSFQVSHNGLLAFDGDTNSAMLSGDNQAMPSAKIGANKVIAGFWDEHQANYSRAEISTKSFGSTGSRQFWIVYSNWRSGNPVANSAYYGFVLEEGTNKIYIVDASYRNSGGTLNSTVGLQKDTATVVAVPGNNVQLDHSAPNSTNHTDNSYYEFIPRVIPDRDAELVAFLSPAGGCGVSDSTPVTLRIHNLGDSAITTARVCYRINGGTPVCENMAGSVPGKGFRNHTFFRFAQVPGFQTFTFDAWVEAQGDSFALNDSLLGHRVETKAAIFDTSGGNRATVITYEGTPASKVLDSFFVTTGRDIDTHGVSGSYAQGGIFSYEVRTPYVRSFGSFVRSWGEVWSDQYEDDDAKLRFCINPLGAQALRCSLWYKMHGQASSSYVAHGMRVLVNGQQVSPNIKMQTRNSDPWKKLDFDLSPYVSGPIEVVVQVRQLRYFSSSPAEFYLDNFTTYIPPAKDFAPVGLVNPASGSCSDSSQLVSVAIRNMGSETQDTVPVQVELTLAGNTTVMNLSSGFGIAPGTNDTLVLDSLNTTDGGWLKVKMTTQLAGDAQAGNNVVEDSVYLVPRGFNKGYLIDTTLCGPVSAYFELADSVDWEHIWYLEGDTTPIDTGYAFRTPLLRDTTVFDVISRINKLDTSSFDTTRLFRSFADSGAGLVLNASRVCSLVSCNVKVDAGSGSIIIQLWDATEDPNSPVLVDSVITPTLTTGNNTVNLGFQLIPGRRYFLVNGTEDRNLDLERGSSPGFPSGIGRAVSILGGKFSTSSSPSTWSAYYFYDIVVREYTCAGYPQKVRVQVPLKPDIPAQFWPEDTIVCNSYLLLAGGTLQDTFVWGGTDTNVNSYNQTFNRRAIPITGPQNTYTVRVTSPAGCTSFDTTTIRIPSDPFVPDFSWVPDTLCGSLKLDAYMPGHLLVDYAWSMGDTVPRVVITQSGQHQVVVSNACGKSDSEAVDVVITPGPVVDLGRDTAICQGEILTLDATQGFGHFYKWDNGVTTARRTVSTADTFFVDVWQPGGCTARDSIIIQINDLPKVDLGPDIKDCKPVTLNAGNPGMTHQWNNGATSRQTVVARTGIYIAKVTNSFGCEAYDSVFVDITSPFSFTLGRDTLTCEPLYALVVPLRDSATYSYQWSTGDTSRAIIIGRSGTYWAKATDTNGCVFIDTKTVVISPLDEVNLGPDITACGSAELRVMDVPPMGTITWSNGDSTLTTNVTTSGTYWAEVAYDCGHTTRDTIQVTINPAPASPVAQPIMRVCDSLVLNSSSAGAVITTSNGQVGNPVTLYGSGLYSIFTTHGANNCVTFDTLDLRVDYTPEIFFQMPDTYYVASPFLATAPFGQVPENTRWTFLPDGTPNNVDEHRPLVQFPTEGSKTLVLEAANGNCSSRDTFTMMLVQLPDTSRNDTCDTCANPLPDPTSRQGALNPALAVQVYPNPTTSGLNLRLVADPGQPYRGTLTLYNTTGQAVLHRQVELHLGQPHYLDVANLPAGHYTLRLNGPLGTASHPVLKR